MASKPKEKLIMAGRYVKAKGRGLPQFVMLLNSMQDSEAWRALRPVERAVWLEVMRRYNGKNNGLIPLSAREAGELCNVSKNTANNALQKLLERGFLRVAQESNFSFKTKTSRRWIVTHESYNTQPPTNDWRNWKALK